MTNSNGLPILPSAVRCGGASPVSLTTQGLLGGLDSFATRTGCRLEHIFGSRRHSSSISPSSASSSSSSSSSSSLLSYFSISCPSDPSISSTFTLSYSDVSFLGCGEKTSIDDQLQHLASTRLQTLQELLVSWIGSKAWWDLSADPSSVLSSDRDKARHIVSISPVLVAVIEKGVSGRTGEGLTLPNNTDISPSTALFLKHPLVSTRSSDNSSSFPPPPPHCRINLSPPLPLHSRVSDEIINDREWDDRDPQSSLSLFVQDVAAQAGVPHVALFLSDDNCPLSTTAEFSKTLNARCISLSWLMAQHLPKKKTFGCFIKTIVKQDKEEKGEEEEEIQYSIVKMPFTLSFSTTKQSLEISLGEDVESNQANSDLHHPLSTLSYSLLFLSPKEEEDTSSSTPYQSHSLSYDKCLKATHKTLKRMSESNIDLLHAFIASLALAEDIRSRFSHTRSTSLLTQYIQQSQSLQHEKSFSSNSVLSSSSSLPSSPLRHTTLRLSPPIICAEYNRTSNTINLSVVRYGDHVVLKDAIQRKFVTEIEINDVIRQVSFTLLEGMANLLFQQQTHDSTLSSILTTETSSSSSSSSSSVVTQSLAVSCSSTGAQIQVEIMASPRGEWARAFVRNVINA